MKIIGTESEIRDMCLGWAMQTQFCPIMQWTKPGEAPIDFGCIGTECNSMEMVYNCLLKRVDVMVIPF